MFNLEECRKLQGKIPNVQKVIRDLNFDLLKICKDSYDVIWVILIIKF